MDLKKKTGLAIGTAVIGIGAALGVAGIAGAATSATTTTSTTQVAPADQTTTDQSQTGQVPTTGQAPADGSTQGQPPADSGHQGGPAQLASGLASALNADQATIQTVLDEVFAANQQTGTPPDMDTMDANIAKALSPKINVDESKILEALKSLRPSGTMMPGQDQSGTQAGAQTGTQAGTQSGTQG
ncbi:MAG: hypothetical protein HZY73_06335 [Micropruina sp.]|nr:MAG: hypothetical protein HZY73_06335 [Micropruina sp.]